MATLKRGMDVVQGCWQDIEAFWLYLLSYVCCPMANLIDFRLCTYIKRIFL